MEAKELRIGNWVLINDTPNIIRGGGIAAIEAGYFKMPLCPIPLTPEILVKAGFEVINHVHGYSFYSMDRKGQKRDRPAIDIYDTKTLYMGQWVNHCKYVHQLQNLYFALTGEELEINFAPVKPEFPKDRIGQWKGGA